MRIFLTRSTLQITIISRVTKVVPKKLTCKGYLTFKSKEIANYQKLKFEMSCVGLCKNVCAPWYRKGCCCHTSINLFGPTSSRLTQSSGHCFLNPPHGFAYCRIPLPLFTAFWVYWKKVYTSMLLELILQKYSYYWP